MFLLLFVQVTDRDTMFVDGGLWSASFLKRVVLLHILDDADVVEQVGSCKREHALVQISLSCVRADLMCRHIGIV